MAKKAAKKPVKTAPAKTAKKSTPKKKPRRREKPIVKLKPGDMRAIRKFLSKSKADLRMLGHQTKSRIRPAACPDRALLLFAVIVLGEGPMIKTRKKKKKQEGRK